MGSERFDKIIIGAGLYGLYSALFCCKKGENILVLEYDPAPFKRATYINQARVHQGYHYPRSISTAVKSAGYFERFNRDYDFCVNKEFDQIYATSSQYSWSDRKQFKDFCKAANIPCEELHPGNYFKDGMCDGVFRTREYTYDAMILKDYFLDKLSEYPNSCTIKYGVKITAIEKNTDTYLIRTEDGNEYESGFVLNSTYASTNQILDMVGYEKFGIKYELCEIILCKVNDKLKDIGFTVMDGPFFSIMPFGKTGYHSLTSVTFTPHTTSYDGVPTFECQARSQGFCSTKNLGNCNDCPAKPVSAFPYMSNLARKYMLDDYEFTYEKSLFSMKPILMSSEIDDSRPTVIRQYSEGPTFVAVLSGKINTVYDLDEVLSNGK
ncbi:FAD-dependent oxidoreductase [Pseudobutyrivibrio ruminis]|uniref:FAD dependent oxidoreductase n=1 Tax=Pseudobutyrivibrio ruminis DSM 9787 TaxID=1123011 RepID=A0A285S987_9FIRM|nr:FAD-dependent oxidoreductase [Pseudobutyrivibrio ruminis]SOC04170.1 FAD dependent oxidoreductase [Pseudobutyrivibrio ruminis DSM 9787]